MKAWWDDADVLFHERRIRPTIRYSDTWPCDPRVYFTGELHSEPLGEAGTWRRRFARIFFWVVRGWPR